eukprot:285630_1
MHNPEFYSIDACIWHRIFAPQSLPITVRRYYMHEIQFIQMKGFEMGKATENRIRIQDGAEDDSTQNRIEYMHVFRSNDDKQILIGAICDKFNIFNVLCSFHDLYSTKQSVSIKKK